MVIDLNVLLERAYKLGWNDSVKELEKINPEARDRAAERARMDLLKEIGLQSPKKDE